LESREALIQHLHSYQTDFKEEKLFIPHFLDLLKSDRCYFRDYLPGHITGSAWIVNETKTHTLLVHHVKLGKWLQPGGHADGDENVMRVSLKEATEETGLKNLTLLTPNIFDIDIHPIPARKDFQEHLHFDIRFAFVSSVESTLQVSNESHDVKWIALEEVPERSQHNTSILRMIQKTIAN
jgi:8-oxo-dGTP pyrophosphatase MutT (NUDIX family)